MPHKFALLLLLCAGPARADRMEAIPMKIISGDRLVVMDRETKKRHQIELAGIMAPVKGQPYHASAIASLDKLVRKKVLVIDWDKVADRCSNRPDTCPKIGRV